jgi:hypothetical protein
VVEGARGPGEAAPQRTQRCLDRPLLGIEGAEEDAVEAADVDQVEGEGSAAGRIETGGGVLLAEGEELLALAQLRPGERPLEELRGEGFHVRTEFTRPADDAVRGPERVGRLLGRVVVRVGRASATMLAGMDLHEFAAAIELHETAVATDFQLRPRWAGARRHRVERLVEADVVVRMDGHRLPRRHVVDDAVVGQQLRLLLRFEDLARELAGCAMDAKAGNLPAPALGLLAAVLQVAEAASLKEAFSHVLDAALDVRLVARPPDPGRVDEEAAFLRVLEEAAGRPWLQGVRSRDGRREVVDDESPGDAAEEPPGGLQPFDALLQRLP